MAANTKTTVKDNEDVVDPGTGEVLKEGSTGTELTTADANAGALVAADDGDYGEDIGAGFENQTGEDVSVPFLVILQPGSPEVQGEEAVAKAGMIINKTTADVMSGRDGVSFIPALTEHLLVEWVPRDKGGGLVAQHAIDSELARQVRASQPLGTYKHPENGNDLIETFYVYGVALDSAGMPYPAVMAFSSTHIKAYKDWMFRARSIVVALPDGRKLTKVPLFSHCYQIRTQRQDKNNNTWYTPVIGFAGKDAADSRLTPSNDIYKAAKSVREAVSGGTLKADTANLGSGQAVDAAPVKGDTSGEEAPY